jgi:GNAT superfamily N-acetyltransferase
MSAAVPSKAGSSPRMSGSLSHAELLALYDHDERIAAVYPDTRREVLGDLVRHIDLVEHSGVVLYSRLDELTADAAIREQIAYFAERQTSFEWKAYTHDRPADLIQRLARHGFVLDEPEAILVLEPRAASEALLAPTGVRIERVERPDELEAITSIKHQVTESEAGDSDHVRRLRVELEHDPTYLSVYLAYVDDTPAACGWVRFPHSSAFASLWGGSTVPRLRGRGLYTALLAARVREARERGVRYLTVDARSMSRPILERRGFTHLTTATACTWSTE